MTNRNTIHRIHWVFLSWAHLWTFLSFSHSVNSLTYVFCLKYRMHGLIFKTVFTLNVVFLNMKELFLCYISDFFFYLSVILSVYLYSGCYYFLLLPDFLPVCFFSKCHLLRFYEQLSLLSYEPLHSSFIFVSISYHPHGKYIFLLNWNIMQVWWGLLYCSMWSAGNSTFNILVLYLSIFSLINAQHILKYHLL